MSAPATDYIKFYVHCPGQGQSSATVMATRYADYSGHMIQAIHPQYPGADCSDRGIFVTI